MGFARYSAASVLAGIASAGFGNGIRGGAETWLVRSGQPTMAIVISPKATAIERQAANDLASVLKRISGATFQIKSGEGGPGIVLGSALEFPTIVKELDRDTTDPDNQDDYLLRTDGKSVQIIGTTDIGAQNGVWDLLGRLGYRQFFPGPKWEFVPTSSDVSLSADGVEHPSFVLRRFVFGGGTTEYNAANFEQWRIRNRMTVESVIDAKKLETAHSYDGIVARHKADFDAHPEWLGALGQRAPKFSFANSQLRALIVQDSLEQFRTHPKWGSISLTPSDGSGWVESPAEEALGSITDRVVGLANEVAVAVRKEFPGKRIGIYSYDKYSVPPTIPVDKDVVVAVATSFTQEGNSVPQIIEGWKSKGAKVGIREYYSVWPWDLDLPGKSEAADKYAIADNLAAYREEGAEYFITEAGDNWGPYGPGYYMSTRVLWKTEDARNREAIFNDFLTKCFGSAKSQMAEFYALIDGSRKPMVSDYLIKKMYVTLANARKATSDPAAQARIDDLSLYTRYVDLYFNYQYAKGPEKDQAGQTVLDFVSRIRTTSMVHAIGLYRNYRGTDRKPLPPEIARSVDKAPAEEARVASNLELEQIARRPSEIDAPDDVEEKSFSGNLTPLADRSPVGKPGTLGYLRGKATFYAYVRNGEDISLSVTAGLIYNYLGPARIRLYKGSEGETIIDKVDVTPDKILHDVTLKTQGQGVYRIELNDSNAGTKIDWMAGQTIVIESDRKSNLTLNGHWSMYFYVPSGTAQVAIYSTGVGQLVNAAGQAMYTFGERPGFASIPVPPGSDGQAWHFVTAFGQKLVLNVPPFLARTNHELLVHDSALRR